MLNLVVEKGVSKDRDRSRSSITWPRTGIPMGFVQRFRFDFGLGTSPYIVDIFFLLFSFFYFLFYFSSIVVALTSCPRASFLIVALTTHTSSSTLIFFLHT